MTAGPVPSSGTPTADRVLGEAVRLFDEAGFHAASTRELAERLGVKKATLYYHIAGKDALLYEICKVSNTRIDEPVRTACERTPAPERLNAMVRAHLIALLDDRAMHRVAFIESRALSEAHAADIARRRDEYSRRFLRVIRDDQIDGRIIGGTDPRMLTTSLLSMINWPVFWFSDDRGTTPDALADFMMTVFVSGAGRAGSGA